jgi:hypothetical protein
MALQRKPRTAKEIQLCTAIRQNRHKPRGFFKATTAGICSAGFQTCCIADFQVGRTPAVVQSAGLETRDTADLEVCATGVAATPRYETLRWKIKDFLGMDDPLPFRLCGCPLNIRQVNIAFRAVQLTDSLLPLLIESPLEP